MKKECLYHIIETLIEKNTNIDLIECNLKTRFKLFKELKERNIFWTFIDINNTDCKYRNIDIKINNELIDNKFKLTIK